MDADKIDMVDAEDDLPLYDEQGVDLSLIRYMMTLSPREKLMMVQNHARVILGVRERAKAKSAGA